MTDHRQRFGPARFSLLGSGLVRLEYSPTQQFEDRPSVRALGRPEAVAFETVERDGDAVRLHSAALTIRYVPDGAAFSAGNLQVLDRRTGQRVWVPGQVDETNLGGAHLGLDVMHRVYRPRGVHPATTEYHPNGHEADYWGYTFGGGNALEAERYRNMTLEQVLAAAPLEQLPAHIQRLVRERAKYPPGILSRAGYFLYNDSATPLWDETTGWWGKRASPGALDYYLFYYGRNYAQALADYRRLFGPTPLPPRYSLGLWYSRYPTFDEPGLRELVAAFARHDLPLDVLVIDLEWHKNGWAGYDWNTDHIHDPVAFLRFLRDAGIHTTLNVHPWGFSVKESRYQAFVEAAGITVTPEMINANGIFDRYDLGDQRHAEAFLDVLHRPVQDQGVDFWWIDGCAPAPTAPIDDIFWSNLVYQRHIARHYPDRRPMIFSRSGGLGSHRFPFHFTGDTYSQWEVLENQVEYTLRAGHIGLSLVTHDIGGHLSDAERLDPELYARWVQWGVLSPMFRLHSSKGGERRPWEYGPAVLDGFRQALRLRMELLPYLYTMARVGHDTGLPLCRSNPLMHPDWEPGYAIWDAYYLGDRLYAAPILRPGDRRPVLLPPGRWYCGITGARRESDGVTPFTQVAGTTGLPPHYHRAGTIFVKQPDSLRAGTVPDKLILEIYSGGAGTRDTFDLYEDDGSSRQFQTGQTSTTRFSLAEGKTIDLLIGAATGKFAGQPAQRRYEIRVFGLPVARCLVDGQPVAAANGIQLAPLSTHQPHRIQLECQ